MNVSPLAMTTSITPFSSCGQLMACIILELISISSPLGKSNEAISVQPWLSVNVT